MEKPTKCLCGLHIKSIIKFHVEIVTNLTEHLDLDWMGSSLASSLIPGQVR